MKTFTLNGETYCLNYVADKDYKSGRRIFLYKIKTEYEDLDRKAREIFVEKLREIKQNNKELKYSDRVEDLLSRYEPNDKKGANSHELAKTLDELLSQGYK